MGDDRHSEKRRWRFTAKQGFRRIGLVIGIAGAALGSAYSYSQLDALSIQRSQQQKFGLLSDGTVARDAIAKGRTAQKVLDSANLKEEITAEAWDATLNSESPAELRTRLDTLAIADNVKHDLWDARYPPKIIPFDQVFGKRTAETGTTKEEKESSLDLSAGFVAATPENLVSRVHFDRNRRIDFLIMGDGKKFSRDDGPTVSSYLSFAVAPVAGFFLPLFFFKLVIWIGSGFFEVESSSPPL